MIGATCRPTLLFYDQSETSTSYDSAPSRTKGFSLANFYRDFGKILVCLLSCLLIECKRKHEIDGDKTRRRRRWSTVCLFAAVRESYRTRTKLFEKYRPKHAEFIQIAVESTAPTGVLS